MVGILSKIIPSIPDHREITVPCIAVPGLTNSCPHGEEHWISLPMTVLPRGQGGAIATMGHGAVLLHNTTFSNNLAPKARSVAVVSSRRFESIGVKYDSSDGPGNHHLSGPNPTDDDPPVYTMGSTVVRCSRTTCKSSEACVQRDDDSLWCAKCGSTQFVKGFRCVDCPLYMTRSPDGTGCVCQVRRMGTWPTFGSCVSSRAMGGHGLRCQKWARN